MLRMVSDVNKNNQFFSWYADFDCSNMMNKKTIFYSVEQKTYYRQHSAFINNA